MEKRFQIQKEVTDVIVENRFIGLVLCSPRVGKSKCVIDALNTVSRPLEVLILAPKLPILGSWEVEMKKWNLRDNINVDLEWSNSIKKNKKFYDLIVCDEIHDYNLSVLSFVKAKQISGSRILAMTGTLNNNDEHRISNILKLNKLYSYSFEQAIDDGIIADYRITCIGVDLSEDEQDLYTIWDNRFNRAVEIGNHRGIKGIISKRADIIYNSVTKLNKTKELINGIERCLIFTMRIEIAKNIGDSSFHGKSNKNTLIKFSNGEFNKLSVVNMISMGVTISNLKIVIFNQIQSNDSLCIQKALRACNLEGNKIAEIYMIYLKNTQDENWLTSAIKSFNPDKITWM
jgi:superfamily II DNA or RNA helicase